MKLSIITINYNNAEGLEKTIRSIVEQSNTQFEYIVIDGGSTDESKNIIERYSTQINYWVSEPDKGIYNAMNKGIMAAKGEYLLFINSGDMLYEIDTLEKIFSTPFTTDLIYGDLHRRFPDGREDFVQMPNHININHMLYATLTHPTTLIKRSLFHKYGLYREDLKIVSDWAFFLHLIAFTNVPRQHIPITIATFAMDGFSTANEGLAMQERDRVIKESFSFELLEMLQLYSTYQQFYNKSIFQIGRRTSLILKSIFHPQYWNQLIHRRRMNSLIKIFNKTVRKQKADVLSIPIVIINYNRLDDLRKLVNFLLKRKHKNIIIVDNKSSYPPLLEYYKELDEKVTIEIMDQNEGHLVFWKNTYLQEKYAKGYYVVTDSDIIPNEKMPSNYLSQMMNLLDEHKDETKVGLALEIDNIPDTFYLKDKVLAWEGKFWMHAIRPNVYKAQVDTTFALYPPCYKYNVADFLKGLRIAGDFTARHGGWYIDANNMTEEELYYYNTANNSNSWKMSNDGKFVGSNEY